MALHLSATTGEAITAAELLGEGPAADTKSVAAQTREGERRLKQMQKRMKKAGL